MPSGEESNYPRPDLAPADGSKCPQCGENAGKKVSYSWWGGALGPALMKLNKCQACKFQYNPRNGSVGEAGHYDL